MKKAYIVLAHKNAPMVKRLIARLDDGHSHFYLHVDLNSCFDDFEGLLTDSLPLTFLDRNRCYWGDFGMVEATLRGLRKIVADRIRYDAIFLISGQHYPIKSAGELDAYLAKLPYSICMEYSEITPDHHYIGRVSRYYFGRSRWARLRARVANGAAKCFPALQKKIALNGPLFGGSSWWTINMDVAKYVVDYVQRRPDVISYFRHVLSPDESFFHSILLSGDNQNFRSQICNNNLTLIEWPSAHSPHPRTLLLSDLPKIKDTECFLARKFDPEVDSQILDEIDRFF